METIDDIVREMRGFFDAGIWLSQPDSWCEKGCVDALSHYADRIDSMASATARQIEEMAAENARLKAALKPVLEVETSGDRDIYDWSRMFVDAVFESKRIYNEGTK